MQHGLISKVYIDVPVAGGASIDPTVFQLVEGTVIPITFCCA